MLGLGDAGGVFGLAQAQGVFKVGELVAGCGEGGVAVLVVRLEGVVAVLENDVRLLELLSAGGLFLELLHS